MSSRLDATKASFEYFREAFFSFHTWYNINEIGANVLRMFGHAEDIGLLVFHWRGWAMPDIARTALVR